MDGAGRHNRPGSLLAASRCAGSGVCARICPEDALTLTRTVLAGAGPDQDAMAQFPLTFDPSRCTDCGKCLQICPESGEPFRVDDAWPVWAPRPQWKEFVKAVRVDI